MIHIHQNPIKAGLVNDVDDYCWSSWHEYSSVSGKALPICEKSFILDQVDLIHLSTWVKQPLESDDCSHLEEDVHPSDDDVREMLFEMQQAGHSLETLTSLPKKKKERDHHLGTSKGYGNPAVRKNNGNRIQCDSKIENQKRIKNSVPVIHDWYDDSTYIMDLEKFIPDFRRKLAARLIILAGRKNSEGEYCYYLPYSNNPIAGIDDDTIKGLIDEYGFVIALPDVPMKTERGGIIMDLHVTYLTGIIFWTFDSMHQSEFVFHLTQGTVKQPKTKVKKSVWRDQSAKNSDEPPTKNIEEGESYEVTDLPDGGKNVSMNVIVPEDGDEDFDFYSYECRISDKKQIDILTAYMKRFEEGKESRPFLMIGRPCLGLDNIDIFYSLDGEIIFTFIFDEKIKSWIREAGFVLGKVESYKTDSLFIDQLSVTLSVSKRKGGETLFKQASEEAMDYIEEYCSSQADHDVEARIIDAVEKYISGDSATSYKIVIIPQYGIGLCSTLDGDDIAIIVNNEIIELAEKNKGVFGYITKVDYDDDGDAWFTIRVSRSIPRLTLEQESNKSDSAKDEPDVPVTEEQSPRPLSISEEVFAKFISENIGCDILNAPNSSWSYDTTDFLGNGRDMYETYIFKKRVPNNLKCSEIRANVVRGKSVNFCLDFKMNKREIYDFVYRYKKLFIPDYTFAKCKKEYASEQFSIYTEGITPSLDIRFPFMGDPCSMVFYTSFCNTAYVEKKKEQKKILTLEE